MVAKQPSVVSYVRDEVVRSRATLALMVVNIAVYLMLTIQPGLVDMMLLDPNELHARPWTLVTVFFAHQVGVHLLANLFILGVFGRAVEQATHGAAVVLIYVIAGLAGSLTFPLYASLIGFTGLVAGASAAAWALAATYAVVCPTTRVAGTTARWWVGALFVGNLVLAVLNPEVSVGAPAHVAGLMVGGIGGLWVKANLNH